MKSTATTISLLLAPALVLAHPGHHNQFDKRQSLVTVDGNVIPPISELTSGNPVPNPTSQLLSTPSPSQAAPIPSAPPLPDVSKIIPANYPPFREIPPIDSPQVKEWLKELEGHQIPEYTPNISPACADNPAAVADTSRCWWTCHKCHAPEDIGVCPDKMTWGLTFDDGPSPETPKLLNYLNAKGVKATFYVIGSNVMARPAMLQAEYVAGHEISIHGWSHTPLTTLTTPQIVAELGWTRKVIKDVLGVTPNTYRPPQADMDNRVRAIAKAMGLTAVLWTEDSTGTFDSFDWQITGGLKTGQQQWDAFQKILATAETRTDGFITLQHDLHPETVNFALHVIPNALASNKYKMMPVADCLKKPHSEFYMETATVKTHFNIDGVPTNSTSGATHPATGSASKTGTGANPTGTTNQQQGTNAGVGLTAYAPAWMAASLGLVLAAMMRL